MEIINKYVDSFYLLSPYLGHLCVIKEKKNVGFVKINLQ